MRIYIASDHAGFNLKAQVVIYLKSFPSIEVEDLGPFDQESVDYPDFANRLCKHIPLTNQLFKPSRIGILICGSGQGMSMRANKFSHIRAALCWNVEIAKLAREHNDANVLCLGANFTPPAESLNIVQTFIKTSFAQGRHLRRVVKVSKPTP